MNNFPDIDESSDEIKHLQKKVLELKNDFIEKDPFFDGYSSPMLQDSFMYIKKPEERIELSTYSLRVNCSTLELLRQLLIT
jgi:hypothetical protein